ncbi:kirola-like [Olea europaea subsp. europaea]|uniref:Kirola-like n=1 Tax=Olea europaea subsp. europaea TaxID=158383 RepID=A0A8S0V9N6_OLEEU|nr:kirola-like [Olea europaea subsp. europaea]
MGNCWLRHLLELHSRGEEESSERASFHVETNGDVDLVTWTFKYEKRSDDIEDPLSLLGVCIKLTKDIESHHLRAA